MKTKSLRSGLLQWTLLLAIIGLLAAMALPTIAHAQDAASAAVATGPATLDAATGDTISAPAESPALTLVQGLSALLVPVIVLGVRKLAPALSKVWIPVIAAGLGLVAEVISAFATGHSANIWLGAILGLAGVGIREATKQLRVAATATAAS